MLDYSKSFIETQFPVSKISKESYKERKANMGQTLTGLGKWWGRKPLILVRASILGVLLPVSDNPKKDREIFLKLLTMDDAGLCLRKFKNLQTKEIYSLLTIKERERYFKPESTEDKPMYKKGITKHDKDYLQILTFARLSYDDKLEFCERPEHIKNLPEEIWSDVNAHLGTHATNFHELVRELGEKRYGCTPRIGDCFTGGGSIPFESVRMGANVYASDLNPIASLLTWSALNITSASKEKIEELRLFQQRVYDEVDRQLTEWEIEHNEEGHRADSYLYCNQTKCPECGYTVPLLPSLIIGKGTRTIVELLQNDAEKNFDIKVIENANRQEFEKAQHSQTIKSYSIECPCCNNSTPIPSIRKDYDDGVKRPYRYNTPNALRKWEKTDFTNHIEDIFTERLYCIRYIETIEDCKGNIKQRRYYKTPTNDDLKRERRVNEILSMVLKQWQDNGYVPETRIEEGWNTNQLTYEKGWTYWHHVFNPRQLLVNGLFVKLTDELATNQYERAIGILGINKISDWNSKLCIWNVGAGTEKTQNTFTTQSLNTLFNYGVRALNMYQTNWFMNINPTEGSSNSIVLVKDAREVDYTNDIWITDPPYADAVNYHELTEFFLAWDKRLLEKAFPEWYTDSKRILAVKGTGKTFNDSMIEVYKNLANYMPEDGTQIVMFTHQDVKVWAELAMILWSAGLRVVSAWNIATETESGGLKSGNYVKGTVILILKKQKSDDIVFQDELYEEIKNEVQFQIDSMRELDDKEDPNFTDADYLLASYASSLKVLTSYKNIEGIDVEYELAKIRIKDEESPIEIIINKAIKIAYDYLIPVDVDRLVWRDLSPEERFFIRGLELEMGNIYQISAYQELARGFGVVEYKDMYENFKANTVRLKTASEYKTKGLNGDSFGSSLLRHLLIALHIAVEAESTMDGRNYLKATYNKNNEYWNLRINMIEILGFISRLEKIGHMKHWHEDAYYARLLKEVLKNDGI